MPGIWVMGMPHRQGHVQEFAQVVEQSSHCRDKWLNPVAEMGVVML